MSNIHRFNTEIYSLKYIQMAIMAYVNIADIEIISYDDTYYTCKFKNCKYECTTTIKEFENYLIA